MIPWLLGRYAPKSAQSATTSPSAAVSSQSLAVITEAPKASEQEGRVSKDSDTPSKDESSTKKKTSEATTQHSTSISVPASTISSRTLSLDRSPEKPALPSKSPAVVIKKSINASHRKAPISKKAPKPKIVHAAREKLVFDFRDEAKQTKSKDDDEHCSYFVRHPSPSSKSSERTKLYAHTIREQSTHQYRSRRRRRVCNDKVRRNLAVGLILFTVFCLGFLAGYCITANVYHDTVDCGYQ